MKIDRKQIRYSLQLLLHLQKNKVDSNQDGYAMLITSILAILMFSMLSVYLFSANLYKSVANAVVDSGSTFYAAESGMNKRSNIVRNRFEGYSQPIGNEPSGTTVAMQMQNCIDNLNSTVPAAVATLGTGDLACDVSNFDYKESRWKATIDGSKESFESEFSNNNNPDIKYRAYSFVKRVTPGDPEISTIPPGEDFAGLNMQEYKYRLYSTALKNTSSDFAVSAQTLLQMDFNSRVIPIFQFAAFYDGDMEITSSSNMDLAGPIHSNNNIYLAPGGSLTVGQITAARRRTTAGVIIPGTGGIYKSLSRVPTHGGLNPGFRFRLGSNPYISVRDAANAWLPINTRVSAADLAANLDVLRENTSELRIPAASSLSSTGDYNTKADLRVVFDPNNGSGFTMTSVQRTVNATTGAVTATPTTFTTPMLRSLRQPVMLRPMDAAERDSLCRNTPATTPAVAPLFHPTVETANMGANFTSATLNNSFTSTPADITTGNALRIALAKTTFRPYTFTEMNTVSMGSLPGDLKSRLEAELGTTLTNAQNALTPRAIANAAGRCFLPAPIQILTNQQDRQEERRQMQILQSNVHSLTIWNRDGLYADDAGTGTISADGQLFARKVANPAVLAGYERTGLAASDRSEGGLVWHFSVRNDGTYPTAYPGTTTPAATVANPTPTPVPNTGLSNYGFGFSGGRWLPGPLTLATDQIAYVQGDFNNPGGVQPANVGDTTVFSGTSNAGAGVTGIAISRDDNLTQKNATPAAVMADAIGVLSNACVGLNGEFTCFNGTNTTRIPIRIDGGEALPRAATTSINAAFFAGTTPLGGLNNYMRMMENWGGSAALSIFRYRGSFVSTGAPLKVSGGYYGGGGTAVNIVRNGLGVVTTNPTYYNIPGRDYGYDDSFNTVTGLPPLTPKAVYLKQKVFRRDYNSDRTQF
jgi:hypothetical protein